MGLVFGEGAGLFVWRDAFGADAVKAIHAAAPEFLLVPLKG